MAQRITRAVLALLCAVAVVYGTAMFPAAFDVELRSEQPGGPAGPSTPVDAVEGGPGSSGTQTPNETDSGKPADSTETRSATPSRSSAETETPTAAGAHSGGAGGDSGGNAGALGRVLAILMIAGVGVATLLSLGFGISAGKGSWSWPAFLPVPDFVSGLSRSSLSLQRIPQLTTLLIISGGSGLARLADDVATIVSAVVGSLFAGAGPVAAILARSIASLPRVVGALLVAPVRALGTAVALFGGLTFVRGGISRPSFGGSETPATDARTENAPAPAPTDDESEPVASVLEAWAAMTDLVPVRNPETKTAAEYARAAIAAGLPAAPVERLTALFREVRYGGRADSEDRVSAARRALDALTGGGE